MFGKFIIFAILAVSLYALFIRLKMRIYGSPIKEKTQLEKLCKLNVKMSNMNMKIFIDFSNTKNKPKNGFWIKKEKLENYMIPTFTKKIFASLKHNI